MEDGTLMQAELETCSTPTDGSQAAVTHSSPATVESSWGNDGILHRSLIGVPPELLVMILQASLPIVDPMLSGWNGACKLYMKRLFSLRLVSRGWRDILDDTRSFWVVLTSTVPLNVNHTTITRSGGAPLIVHFGPSPIPSWNYLSGSSTQVDEFTELVGPIRDRWKMVCVDEDAVPTVWKYFTSPAPTLETVRLHTDLESGVPGGALELLGGETHNIRQLDLQGRIIRWNRPTFRGLKYLGLSSADLYGLTADLIIDILAHSPDLVYLKLESMQFTGSDTTLFRPVVLPHLQTIELMFLPGSIVFALLRHIEAPHCQRIRVRATFVPGSNELMDEGMGSFESLLREIHEKSGGSYLSVTPRFVDWRSYLTRGGSKHTFEVIIRSRSFVSLLRLIERVADGGDLDGLEMNVYISGENTLPDPEVTSALQRLRNVIWMRASHGSENSREALRLACNLNDNSIPILSSLTLLRIDYAEISAEEMLLTLRTRLAAHFNNGSPSKLPDLHVVAELALEARPEPIKSLDFATIAQIRAIPGVKFTLTRLWEVKDRAGMCAIVWDDENDVPRWM